MTPDRRERNIVRLPVSHALIDLDAYRMWRDQAVREAEAKRPVVRRLFEAPKGPGSAA